MFIHQIEAAIAVASSTALVELNRAIWSGLSTGALSEEDAGRLAEAIHARQVAAKATQRPTGAPARSNTMFPPRRPQRAPDRAVAIERRRRLAASGPLPPALAAKFTTSELAVLRIVADEAMRHGTCRLYLDTIAARAGVSRSTVRNTMREARLLGLLKVQERPQHGGKSLSNVVTVVDKAWRTWLEKGPGRKKIASSDTDTLSTKERTGSSSSNREGRPRFARGVAGQRARKSPA